MNHQITIISDGTPQGTKVIDLTTGKALESNIKSIQINISVDNLATAKIEFVKPELKIKALSNDFPSNNWQYWI
jgi:hypothetical protein